MSDRLLSPPGQNNGLPPSEKKKWFALVAPPQKSYVPSLRYLLYNSKLSFIPERNEFHTALFHTVYMQDNLACKKQRFISFSAFFYASLASKEIHTDISVVSRLYSTGTRMSVSLWNENPNKLIEKWFVSNRLYSGVMWQPVWTRSGTKLIPISCKRPPKSFYFQSITLCSPV